MGKTCKETRAFPKAELAVKPARVLQPVALTYSAHPGTKTKNAGKVAIPAFGQSFELPR